jgi:transcriptional regulator with XRE-family HTH domain
MSGTDKASAVVLPTGGSDFRTLRRQFGLSPTQVAEALDVSPATVEAWERGLNSPPDIRSARTRVDAFAQADPSGQQGKNLLFGHYPLRLARELLSLSVDEMASRFGFSKSHWTKVEANFRTLPPETLKEIETFVRARLAEVCGI